MEIRPAMKTMARNLVVHMFLFPIPYGNDSIKVIRTVGNGNQLRGRDAGSKLSRFFEEAIPACQCASEVLVLYHPS
jgi:hypothetical protein